MARTLKACYGQELAGKLVQDDEGQMTFQCDASWLGKPDEVIFNLLIGNHDAHGKNFSFLYFPDRSIRRAPHYDLVSTVFYPELTDRMAMKIGKQPKSVLIYPDDVSRNADYGTLQGVWFAIWQQSAVGMGAQVPFPE